MKAFRMVAGGLEKPKAQTQLRENCFICRTFLLVVHGVRFPAFHISQANITWRPTHEMKMGKIVVGNYRIITNAVVVTSHMANI